LRTYLLGSRSAGTLGLRGVDLHRTLALVTWSLATFLLVLRHGRSGLHREAMRRPSASVHNYVHEPTRACRILPGQRRCEKPSHQLSCRRTRMLRARLACSSALAVSTASMPMSPAVGSSPAAVSARSSSVSMGAGEAAAACTASRTCASHECWQAHRRITGTCCQVSGGTYPQCRCRIIVLGI